VAKELFYAWLPMLIFVALALGIMAAARRKVNDAPDLPETLVGPADSITIGRDKAYNGAYRKLTILIDGERVGDLLIGEVRHFGVSLGTHAVQTQMDWCRSPPLNVEKRQNENIAIRCGTAKHILLAMFYAFIRPKRYTYVLRDG
jgi:hypothetical protein